MVMFLLLFVVGCQHIDGDNITIARQKLAARYNTQLGLAYMRKGDWPRAKQKFLQALNEDKHSPEVNASFAYYLEKTGEVGPANKYYLHALAQAPDSGAQLNNYGAYLCRVGHYRLADIYFQRAVRDLHYENTAGAYENAGLCALENKNNAQAIVYFTKALVQDATRRQALYEIVKYNMQKKHYKKVLLFIQKYQEVSLRDPILLTWAIQAAHNSGKLILESHYKKDLRICMKIHTY